MWAANARWVCTFALGFYRFARQCEIPIIKRCFLLYMRAANGSDKSAQLNRLALVTRQCVKYQNAMLAQMAFWVPLMQAAKALTSLHFAQVPLSLHRSTKSKCTDEFTPENADSVCNHRCVVSMLQKFVSVL